MRGGGGRSGCFEDIPRKKEKNTSYYYLCDGDYQTDYDNLTQIEENISVAPPPNTQEIIQINRQIELKQVN